MNANKPSPRPSSIDWARESIRPRRAGSPRVVATRLFSSILLLMSLRLYAQSTVNVGTARGYPGLTVPVPVTAYNVSNVVAAQFEVAFDSSRVSALQSQLGARLTNHVIKSRQIAPGRHRVLIYSLANAMVGRSNALYS